MEHVKGSQTDRILTYIREAATEDKICTGPCIAKDLGIKRSNVYIFLRRLRKWHTIDVAGEGASRTFTYVGETRLLKGIEVDNSLKERAINLLKASKETALTLDTVVSVLNVSYPDALEVMAYLVKRQNAYLVVNDVLIKHR